MAEWTIELRTEKRTRIFLVYDRLIQFFSDADTWNEIKDELLDDRVSVVLKRSEFVVDRVVCVPGSDVRALVAFWSFYYY